MVQVFDHLMQKLGELERGTILAIDIETDDNGYLDRLCPSTECGADFKVMFEDWRDIVRDEAVYCPICRHKAESSEWKTPEQAAYFREAALSHVQDQLGVAIRRDSQRLNSRQKPGAFLQLKMSYRPGNRVTPIPASALALMTQESVCSECNCRYSSVGAAFFCPSCGHNSILDTFANSLETVKSTLIALPHIRETMTDHKDENVAEDLIRHIRENGLVKVVSSFQRYADACFARLANAGQFTVRSNLFQNLRESDTIWRGATGVGYSDILDTVEFQELSVFFQQRHLFVHNEGIIDQQYIDRARDNTFAVGQRLVVSESSVVRLARVVEKLAAGIAALK